MMIRVGGKWGLATVTKWSSQLWGVNLVLDSLLWLVSMRSHTCGLGATIILYKLYLSRPD